MAAQQHTPLIAQYLEIRAHYPDTLLFFQVGDFYELFFEDALVASQVLAITLTKRGKSNGTDIPLCGVPVHALGHYVTKLVKSGYAVALCDQLSKPQPGTIVERAVTKIYTPGTLTDEQLLDTKVPSYLCLLMTVGKVLVLSFTEVLTGRVVLTSLAVDDLRSLESELARWNPSEIVVPSTESTDYLSMLSKQGYCVRSFQRDVITDDSDARVWSEKRCSAQIREHAQKQALHSAIALLHHYLLYTIPLALEQIEYISWYQPSSYLLLDAATQRNLDIVLNGEKGTAHTLFSVLDVAQTGMGSRLLKKWLVRPLRDESAIAQRHEVVAFFSTQVVVLEQLRNYLKQCGDIERVVGRIALKRATFRDYAALRSFLEILPSLVSFLFQHGGSIPYIAQLLQHCPSYDALCALLQRALAVDEEGIIIAHGYHAELDELRQLVHDGAQRMQAFAQQEAQQHDISSLKVLYTGVTGYFIEVTHTHKEKVPAHYQQIQTLVNRSRYVTSELKALESKLSSAQAHSEELEKQLYQAVEYEVYRYVSALRGTAHALATIDVLYAFSYVAYAHQYVRPTFNTTGSIEIVKGRHPVVEQVTNLPFIANDTALSNDAMVWLVTGPNMGGKSTYLRQVALIAILAQCGSFVPAASANLMICDRIFTRIGAGDNLAQGKSTFLLEMEESATICTAATKESLVILDEVGRGTSTEDGRALAQAMVEYLLTTVGARTLFATHYHELTLLAEAHVSIKNYYVSCLKKQDELLFTHQLKPGVARSSFGIDVAKLAHMPPAIITRARALIFEHASVMPAVRYTESESFERVEANAQQEVIAQLQALSVDDLSPREAHALLCQLREKAL